MTDDNLTYGAIVTVQTGSDEAITALTSGSIAPASKPFNWENGAPMSSLSACDLGNRPAATALRSF